MHKVKMLTCWSVVVLKRGGWGVGGGRGLFCNLGGCLLMGYMG